MPKNTDFMMENGQKGEKSCCSCFVHASGRCWQYNEAITLRRHNAITSTTTDKTVTITNSTIIVDNSGEVTVDNMQAGERLEKYEVELLRIYNALPSIRLQILFMQRALDFEEEFSGK